MSAYRTITTDNCTIATNLTFPNRININNVPTGAANSVLISNAGGLPVYGNIGAGNVGGGLNEQSLWNSAGTSTWLSRSFRYGYFRVNFSSQDWNSASTTALTFSSNNSASVSFGTSTFTNISQQTAGTTLQCNTVGVYEFCISACLSNGGVAASSIRFNVLVNGNPSGIGPCITLGIGETGTIASSLMISLALNDLITFRSTRLSGTSALTADNNNSQISIKMVQILT